MWTKIIFFVVLLYIILKISKYLYYKLTVKNTTGLNSIAATASLYLIDEILSKFMNDNRLKETKITYEESLNYAYEMSAIAFGYLSRFAFHILDERQSKYFILRLEKWTKSRLAYRGTGSIKNSYATLAYEYTRDLISRRILLGHDGVLTLISKYDLDPNNDEYKFLSCFSEEIIDYIHDNYEQDLLSVTNNKDIVGGCK